MSRFLTSLSSPALQSAQRGLRLAVHRTGPVWLGMFALGLGLGVLVTSNGLPCACAARATCQASALVEAGTRHQARSWPERGSGGAG